MLANILATLFIALVATGIVWVPAVLRWLERREASTEVRRPRVFGRRAYARLVADVRALDREFEREFER